jgi:hypothetical protein
VDSKNLDILKINNSGNLDDINFDDDIQVNKIEKILNIIQKEKKEPKEVKENKIKITEYNNFEVDNNKNIKEENKKKMNIHFDKSVDDKNNNLIEISNINFDDDIQNIPEIEFEDLTLTEIKNTNTTNYENIKEDATLSILRSYEGKKTDVDVYNQLYKEAKQKVKEFKNKLKQAEEEAEKLKKKYYMSKNIN